MELNGLYLLHQEYCCNLFVEIFTTRSPFSYTPTDLLTFTRAGGNGRKGGKRV